MKIAGLVLATLIVLGGGAIMGINSTVNYFAQKIGGDIYGGPIPKNVTATFAARFSATRIAWFKDTASDTQVVIFQDPDGSNPQAPLSPPDLPQAIKQYEQFDFIIRGITGAANAALPSRIKLGPQQIKTLVYLDPLGGQTSHLGVLNLDSSQMLFIATKEGMSGDSKEVSQFLQAMPAIQHDSHFQGLGSASGFGAKSHRLIPPKPVQ